MGSAREVVSRMLKYFENEGIVKLSRGSIEIIDKHKLKSYIY
jgi:CRP/FNR family transcriptional regulator